MHVQAATAKYNASFAGNSHAVSTPRAQRGTGIVKGFFDCERKVWMCKLSEEAISALSFAHDTEDDVCLSNIFAYVTALNF